MSLQKIKNIHTECVFSKLSEKPFDPSYCVCEKEPCLSNFFQNEWQANEKENMCMSYGFYLKEHISQQAKLPILVSAFSIASGVLNMNAIPKEDRSIINSVIPVSKQRTTQYPSMLLCQLVVFDGFAGNKLGNQILDTIKTITLAIRNYLGIRFLMIDAINKPKVLSFYLENGFKYVYLSEDKEKIARNIKSKLRTRAMWFDLNTFEYK